MVKGRVFSRSRQKAARKAAITRARNRAISEGRDPEEAAQAYEEAHSERPAIEDLLAGEGAEHIKAKPPYAPIQYGVGDSEAE